MEPADSLDYPPMVLLGPEREVGNESELVFACSQVATVVELAFWVNEFLPMVGYSEARLNTARWMRVRLCHSGVA